MAVLGHQFLFFLLTSIALVSDALSSGSGPSGWGECLCVFSGAASFCRSPNAPVLTPHSNWFAK
jgi:hypothetical protein